MKNWKKMLVMVILGALLLGCATNRSVIDLKNPSVQKKAADKGIEVSILAVEDMRKFEDRPASADIPSLKGGASTAPAEIKERAIARKRNTYGKALGDILLPEGRSVAGIIKKALVIAFDKKGYTVSAGKGIGDITVAAEIKEFWSWFTPGFLWVTMNTKINLDIVIQKDGSTLRKNISVLARNKAASGSLPNWKKAMVLALDDLQKKLDSIILSLE